MPAQAGIHAFFTNPNPNPASGHPQPHHSRIRQKFFARFFLKKRYFLYRNVRKPAKMPAITLSPATPSVTLTGITSAYGTIGSYFVNYLSGPAGQTAPVEAAIFGTQNTNFSILNSGTILSPGTSRLDAGIVLGGVGAVRNTGTIIAPSGIFILGLAAGAYAANTGYIHAEKADGIDILGTGGVNNSGLIIAGTAGIFDGGGLVDNFGTVVANKVDGIDMFGDGAVNNFGFISAAGSGIFDDVGLVENSGTIIAGAVGIKAGTGVNAGIIVATSGYGVLAYGAFTNTSTASISAPNGNGINGVISSAIYNDGRINARNGINLAAESSFYNTGIVNGSIAGVYEGFNFDPYANGRSYITNYLGEIAGAGFGIEIKDSSAYIYNAGLITGRTAVSDYGVIVNRGIILGKATGISIYGALTNTGTITGAAGVVGRGRDPLIVNAGKILGHTGIHIAGGTITNTGLIEGRDKDGVDLTAHQHTRHGRLPGQIYNDATGTIIGASAGIGIAGGGTLVNSGKIISTGGDGVDLASQSLLGNRDQTSKSPSATIAGARYGISLAGAGYLYNNAGTITGGTAAVYMAGLTQPATTGDSGAYLYNYAKLTGGKYGVLSRTGTVNIFDYTGGTISGQTAILAADAYLNIAYGDDNGTAPAFIEGDAAGIVLSQGGTILNRGAILATGTAGTAIYAGPAGAAIFNRGQIIGAEGVALAGRGDVYNGGEIQGSTLGIELKASGTIVNAGLIFTPASFTFEVGITINDAISLASGGTVINESGAEIIGNVVFGTGANRLVLDPGSKIESYVNGMTYPGTVFLAGGTLELGSAKGAIGTVFAFDASGASAITIDKSANWVFAGYDYFVAGAPITNNGAIHQTFGDGATIAAAITGQGDIDIKTGTITLDGAVGAGQTVKFNKSAGDLALGLPTDFAATIQNFSDLDTIDLTGITLSDVQGLAFSAGVLTLDETAGRLTFTFANPSHFAHETFAAFALGSGTGLTLTAADQHAANWPTNNPTHRPTNGVNLITLAP
jgi:hypothetical protein